MNETTISRSQPGPDFCILSDSADQTRRLAQKIAADLDSGVVLALTGDLGSGKTCFVQGLARGLQVPEQCPITSPTFTLVNEYSGRLPLFHVDLYRIEDVADIEDLGLDDLLDGEGITAIEWAERIRSMLPEDFMEIHFEILDDERRKITISGYGKAGAFVDRCARNWNRENPRT